MPGQLRKQVRGFGAHCTCTGLAASEEGTQCPEQLLRSGSEAGSQVRGASSAHATVLSTLWEEMTGEEVHAEVEEREAGKGLWIWGQQCWLCGPRTPVQDPGR